MQQNKNGTLQLSPEGITFSSTVPDKDFDLQLKAGNDFLFTEKTGFKNQLYIIGGGHCALALSQLMCRMDFYIHLIDDRNELNTVEQNIFVHQKTVVDDYADLAFLVPPAKNNYVVIMTVGYRSDAVALNALLGKSFAYLGILGSKNKIKKMLDEFRANGVSEEWLKLIHSPIGIPINSQTTDEIAVSIGAEIIKVKNKKNKHLILKAV